MKLSSIFRAISTAAASRQALFAALFFVAPLCAQQQEFSGPITGYVFDAATHSIRPLIGRPGAANLGAPWVTHWDVASVSPNGKMAIGVRAGAVRLIGDLSRPGIFT